MYVIVIGMGEVGRHIVGTLEHARHDVVVVDNDPEVIREIGADHDVMALMGYGASMDVLARAGADRADLVVACTDHDEVNLVAALAARQLGARRTIARVQGSDWAASDEGVRHDFLGSDVVLHPLVLVAREVVKIARSHGALEVVTMASDEVELVQLPLGKDCKMLHKPLSQLPLSRDVLIAAIVRGDQLEIPGGADVLLPGDRVYLMGRREAINKAEEQFSGEREARRIAVVGGGVVGAGIARMMSENGARVLLIERDRARSLQLAADLPLVEVIHGDGTDLNQLEEEEIGNFDLFVATSDDDEVNLMAGLLARRAGAHRTVVLVHRPDYREIYRQLGIDVVLSPRVVASDHILRYCRDSHLDSLTHLEAGKAEVLEIVCPEGSRAAGIPMHRLNLPRGTLVGAIVRRERVVIPRGDDIIKTGDTVIVLTRASGRPFVERLFRPGVR